jgi:hypothetical protein
MSVTLFSFFTFEVAGGVIIRDVVKSLIQQKIEFGAKPCSQTALAQSFGFFF